MADNQPTILVKKADGTFVRVPLADLKKKAPPVVEPAVVETQKTVEVPKAVVLPKPIVVPKKIEPIVVKAKPEDFRSLLEDNVLPSVDFGSKTSLTRDNEVDKIIKQLSFTILPSFVGRLRSVIQLRLKDVRGTNETKDIALRSIKDGGLGLTESQADELENKCIEEINSFKKSDAGIVKTKTTIPMVSDVTTPQKFSEPMTPATTTPFNSFVHDVSRQADLSTKSAASEFKIDSSLKSKPIIRDVVSKNVAMGPIEEIKFFRLIDLRRLGSNTVEATNRLKQKFVNLKEESVLLFLEAIQAWRLSPLYQEYLDTIDLAFNKHMRLQNVISDKEKITLEEIKALVNMERELGI